MKASTCTGPSPTRTASRAGVVTCGTCSGMVSCVRSVMTPSGIVGAWGAAPVARPDFRTRRRRLKACERGDELSGRVGALGAALPLSGTCIPLGVGVRVVEHRRPGYLGVHPLGPRVRTELTLQILD